MKSFIYSTLALAATLIEASPTGASLEKRQFELINAFAKGQMTHFLGSKNATVELEKFAKTLGASKKSAGKLQTFMRDIVNMGYGLVARKANDLPEREVLQRRTQTTGSKTIKIRYGPFKIPNASIKNMAGEMGMLFNYPMDKVARPCEGKCTIVGMTAGLEYLDGKSANIDTGLWLHHMLLYNIGEGRSDSTCADRDISVPHVIVGTTAKTSERLFASGNERTPLIFPDASQLKVGYQLNENDKFAMLIDLMNTEKVDKTAYLTITYDIIDGHPLGWDHLRPVWLDIAICGTSEFIPAQQSGKFSISSNWTSTVEGEILGAAGHLHTGGTHLTLAIDGKQACDSKAAYGESSEFVQPSTDSSVPAAPGGHQHGTAARHISSMSSCWGQMFPVKRMEKGQNWNLEAFYDLDQHDGVLDEVGEQTEVMGISMVYIKQKSLT